MPERCTCGAQLPEDALFCHKCGKPQRELPQVEEPAPVPPPIVIAAIAPPPLNPAAINFHNTIAVRIALAVGILSALCMTLVGQAPGLAALGWILPPVAGFFAVYLYRRRTGQKLSILNGARLGWISGVVVFAIVTALFTFLVVAISQPAMVAQFKDQMKSRGVPDAALNQLVDALHNPEEILGAVLMFFVLFTVLPAFGGALGAKLLDRD